MVKGSVSLTGMRFVPTLRGQYESGQTHGMGSSHALHEDLHGGPLLDLSLRMISISWESLAPDRNTRTFPSSDSDVRAFLFILLALVVYSLCF